MKISICESHVRLPINSILVICDRSNVEIGCNFIHENILPRKITTTYVNLKDQLAIIFPKALSDYEIC